MSHPTEPPFQTLQFYTTAPYACSYLEGRQARSVVATPGHSVNSKVYSHLVRKGFRRSGLFTYKPQCVGCSACTPIRIDTQRFQPGRTQRRIWQRHQTLQTSQAPLTYKEEHFELYRRYVSSRHENGEMDVDSHTLYTQFLLGSRVDTNLVEFRDTDDVLKAVSIIDILDDGLSAVYTFFDPDAAGSLGTYAILWQINRCTLMHRRWLYLGYWIEESRKMAYKTRYKPYQLLQNGVWEEPKNE